MVSVTTAPSLSVVMPTKDVETWIAETLESILTQDLADLEVIVVDDGSTDSTCAQVERIAEGDPRVRLERNPGAGGAQARNHGVAIARGRYLAFADGDDVVPRRAYATMLASAERTGSPMVVGNHMTIEPQRLATRDQSLPIYGEPRDAITIADEPAFLRDRVCWNRIVDRRAWQELGLAFADSRRSNDILAMTEAYCGLSFDVVVDPVYAYRRRLGSTSMTSAKHRPDAVRDHFAQELACVDAVLGLRNSRVTERYYAGILEFDIWAHGVVAVRAEDSGFDESRALLHALVTRAPRRALDALPAAQRIVYHLVARGMWDAARVLAGPFGPAMAQGIRDLGVEELVGTLLAADPGVVRSMEWVIGSACLDPILDDPYGLDDEQIVALHEIAHEAARAGLPMAALSPAQQAILDADGGHASMLRAASAKAPSDRRSRGLAGGRSTLPLVREVLGQLRRREIAALRGTVGRVRPRHVVAVAREIRPRHVVALSRRLAAAARHRLGRR